MFLHMYMKLFFQSCTCGFKIGAKTISWQCSTKYIYYV